MSLSAVDVFSTAPQSADIEPGAYADRCAEVARWSEEAGCTGILIYTDNRLIDPWLVAQIVIQNTERLCPLVATQPVYMHPYSAAKMIASLGYLYHRRIFLNMVAGGFRNDLLALGDPTPHDERYDRLREYTTIVQELLASEGPVSFSGRHYRVRNLRLQPPLPRELLPGLLMSGSSEAGQATARALGAVAVEYPKPPGEYEGLGNRERAGIRIGLVVDDAEEDAWKAAWERFPPDRKGQIAHKLAMKVSDSHWHRQLSDLGRAASEGRSPYWLWPFENYKTFCPYLVGSYERVAEEVARYIRSGFTTFILDIPAQRRDLQAAGRVFRLALDKAARD